jgi:exodeoxyribonuclease VII large subunit
MPFNTEIVVEAIYKSQIPIITAIGHEVDYSLADLAADLRAATPTQAAVLAVPDINQLEATLARQQERITAAITRKITRHMETLDRIMMKKVWKDPLQLIKLHSDRLQQAQLSLNQAMGMVIEQKSTRLAFLTARLDGVSPLKTMQRGYALVMSGTAVVTRGEQVKPGDELRISMLDADLKVRVMGKEAVSRWKI